MVIRTWMAHTSPDRESEYAAIVRKVVLSHFKTVPGYLGSKFLRRPVDGEVEILVLTYWESMEAARGLAGDGSKQVYVPPEIAATLDRYDHDVAFYEVLVDDSGEMDQGS